jgi:hypothetical protein
VKSRIAAAVIVALAVAGCGGSSSTTHISGRPAGQTICGAAATPSFQVPHCTSTHNPTFGLPPKGAGLGPQTAGPSVEMFDSVTVGTVPSWARAVAGYTAGSWPTYWPLVHAFPRAYHVSIAIQAYYHAQCLDVEPGDAQPYQVAGWIRADIQAGFKRPCVYSNLSEWSQIWYDLRQAGLPRSSYLSWVADWVYHAGLMAGYDAQQWSDHALGRNLDESTVNYAFLGIVAHPVVKPKPKPGPTRAQVAKWKAALGSSQAAYNTRGCPVLAHRVTWFSGELKQHPRVRTQSRKQALAFSRKAYRQQSCAVFAQRTAYFSKKLGK